MDFTTMTNEALEAALAENRTKAEALFALDTPTVEQADEAEALVASIGAIEAEQASRAERVAEAAARFAAAKAKFSAEPEGVEADDEAEEDEAEEDEADEEDSEEEATEEVEASADETADETVEAAADDADDTDDEDDVPPKKKDTDEAMTASADPTKGMTFTNQKRSAASKVAAKTKRPARAAASPVVITASADIPNVPTGSRLDSLTDVAKAAQARAKGFPQFSAGAAQRVADANGGNPALNKFAVASFNLNFEKEHVANTRNDDYSAVEASRKDHVARVNAGIQSALSGKPDTLTAAGWCAPSPYVYNWIADYVVDGLITLPEVSAPRGGLQITQGPQLAQGTYADVDDFGFGGTEAEAIAGYTKECETIECPDFEDHRLDFVGYCWKIPLLTEHAYPELVADAMRLSNVLYAHKMNHRFISDVIAESTAITANGLGSIVLDTLEALVQVAVKERRWWNIGENAAMEIKLPQVAREIFKFDMARRSGLALNDVATDQKIAAYFANHNLSVEYISDFDQQYGAATPTAEWTDTIRAIMYPAGTFAKAVEDVINVSAVYDAASLSQNEYTGIFFEQGVMTMKMGYRSHIVTIPVCAAGVTGANALTCEPGSL